MSLTNRPEDHGFWGTALAWKGSAGPKIFWRVVIFVLYSAVITFFFLGHPRLDFELGIFEVSGAALSILLVIRTNSGYDRWWEARKVWGGVINQSRNLAISSLAYGPKDPEWQKSLRNWTIAFSHVLRRSLRGQRDFPELQKLLPENDIDLIKKSNHMPSYVALRIANLLAQARSWSNSQTSQHATHSQTSQNASNSQNSNSDFDGFAFLQLDRERALLIDHAGACERILKTPIPIVFAIIIRGFMLLFFALVPFVMIPKVGWLTPFLMFIVAFPMLSLDQIGVELQNPFSSDNLSHLPLDEITETVQMNLMSIQ